MSPDKNKSPSSSRSRPHLTKPQQTILDAIYFFLGKGEIPTVREVGALVGLRSPATVLKHLRTLEKEGLISLSGKSRGIRLVDSVSLVPHAFSAGGPSPGRLSFVSGGSPDDGPGTTSGFPSRTRSRGVPLVGAIAAGKPFESYSDAFSWGAGDSWKGDHSSRGHSSRDHSSREIGEAGMEVLEGGDSIPTGSMELPIDPTMFVESGEVFALRVQGDSMINAGILDGDYVIIRRQDAVEEGEIAAVIINGEGTLKRWRTGSKNGMRHVSLQPANERFDPIDITEEDAKDVLVFGKYVGLVRGNLQIV